jgi:hypothetical protein
MRFATAWAMLLFAGQLSDGLPVDQQHFLRGGPGDGWWVSAELTLDTARELVSVATGDVYLPAENGIRRDRGWGGSLGHGPLISLDDLESVAAREVVRQAGLQPRPGRSLSEIVLLLPGRLVAGVTRRALDLGLWVSYQPVSLTPLFDGDAPAHAAYELCLRAGQDSRLPAFFVAALSSDPSFLVCRRAAENLLIQHDQAGPLPDAVLSSLTGDATWVLADVGYGCAQLHLLGTAQDGAALVGRGRDHELIDVSGTTAWAEPGDSPVKLIPPELTLVRARTSGVPVDAALLNDSDLACLPALLAGEPLAITALLIPGRDRHLLTAPGGLLEQLPVGEPLYWIGPGSLYLPLGYRIQPALPPAARRQLFPTDASTGIVVLADAALRYDLTIRKPVWSLWAGAPLPVDDQVPESVREALDQLDEEMTPSEIGLRLQRPAAASMAARRAPAGRRLTPREPEQSGESAEVSRPRDWRDDAYEAELAGDLTKAAELHLQHDDPLRAARLYERAAQRE